MTEDRRLGVLVVEDHKATAEELVKGVETVFRTSVEYFYYDQKDDSVLDRLAAEVRRKKPKVLVVDGLDGRWMDVMALIGRESPDTVCIGYTGSPAYAAQMKSVGYEAYNRPLEQEELDRALNSNLQA